MKIAVFVDQFPCLSETFILDQITGLIDRGHEVDIFANHPGDTTKVHLDVEKYNLLKHTHYIEDPSIGVARYIKGAQVFFSNFWKAPNVLIQSLNILRFRRRSASLALLFSTVQLIGRQTSFDIIHCHFGPNGINAAMLREIGILKGKLVTTFYGYDATSYPHMYGKDTYKYLFSKGDLFTGITHFLIDKVVALGCPKDKIIKHSIGVDVSKYEFKERILSGNQKVKFLTVARLVEKKGIEYSIRATAEVAKTFPNIEYSIVGNGLLYDQIKQLISDLKVGDKVKLLGWKTQDEVRQLYTDSHVFVLSSVTAANGDQEGQGLVLQEAQAMGIPVISTIHNGIPDGVLDGKSGFLVLERDVDALTGKLLYLVKNPEQWFKIGKAGREFVEKNFDVNKLNDKLVKIYEELASDT